MEGKAKRSNEFDRIARYFAPLAASCPGALGLLDDAAVIAPQAGAEFVVTTDTIVAGVHYVGDEAPALVAAKLLRVNLSDLAAMGARPRAYTLNIALPDSADDAWLEGFAAGLAEDQERFGITLIGGDSVSTSGPACFTLTAIGEVPAGTALRRGGAGVGDIVYVSGTVGDGALGLLASRDALRGIGAALSAALIERYRMPQPRLDLGQRLRGIASAAADVSDGLAADLGHIADASDVAATIEAARIPLSAAARAVVAADGKYLETILTGGDDYELVFCVPPKHAETVRRIADEVNLPCTSIGRIVEGTGVTVLDAADAPIQLSRSGFMHG